MPEPVLYKIRPELERSTQTHHGQTFLVVKDPITGRYFRFTESQAIVLELLSSPIDSASLSTRASAKLGVDIPQATLVRLLDSLETRGLLDTPGTRARLAQIADRPGGEQNWLYLKLGSIDAEPVFDWLAPKVEWCFTRAFHLFAASVILTGLVITTIHARSLVGDLLSLLNLYGILLIWLTVVGVGIMHELAHGLTCRHFGGRVKEIGFMLIYFQPAFYCDVSDSWMLPSRRDRMWVTFAGGYFQLVLWGVATIVWRIFAQDTLINWIAMTVIVFSGLQTLVNFNPLIKLDGYYMLSDYLEIPNLRAKGFRAVRSWIEGSADPLLVSDDRRRLLLFGVLSLTFSTLLLVVVYVNIYILATSYFAFAGLTAFVLFAVFTLRRTAAEPAAGARAVVTRASLKKYRNIGIVSGAFLLTFIVPWKLRIPAEFVIQPGQEFQVRALIDGTVEEVLVDEGSRVHRGQELAYLHNSDLRERLTILRGQYESKSAELEQLEAGPRAEEIQRARQLVATRQQALTNVTRNQEDRAALEGELAALEAEVQDKADQAANAATLFEEDLGTEAAANSARQALLAAQARLESAKARIRAFDEANAREEDLRRAELNEAQSALNLLLSGSRPESIEQARSEQVNIGAQMMEVSQELQMGTIVAEISGVVVTPNVHLLEGETVSAGDELMEIQSIGTVLAELRVAEKDLADVSVGSPVVLVANAYPGRDFHGTVGQIADTAGLVDGATFIRVTSELTNEDGALLADMTGHAKIDAGWHPIIHLMTRRLIRWIRTEFWHLLP